MYHPCKSLAVKESVWQVVFGEPVYLAAAAAADHNKNYEYQRGAQFTDHSTQNCFVLKLEQELSNTWQNGVMDEYLEYCNICLFKPKFCTHACLM